MSVEKLIREHKGYREVSSGEFAGPCPSCGGALRLRIWPEQNRFECSHCSVVGSLDALAELLGLESAAAIPCGTASAETAPHEHLSGFCCRITAPSGLDYWLTDRRDEWRRLSGTGEIVFSAGEVERIGRMVDMAGDQASNIAEMCLVAKKVFPGIYVNGVRPDVQLVEYAMNTSGYRGKFNRFGSESASGTGN